MRRRVIFWVSLGLNVALAATLALYLRSRSFSKSTLSSSAAISKTRPDAVVKTNTVVRRLNFVWNQIESSDYRVYIANLRNIGCPEATIRDIIVAEVNEIFARRRATEIVTAEQQWWRSEPDAAVEEAAAEKLRKLETERKTLLTDLLGPEWQSSYYPYPDSPRSSALDGPVLGTLSPQVKQAVREIERHSAERRIAYLQSVQKEGKRPDPAELEHLRQQMRIELAQTLTPEQLEEYLLRYSQDASSLRGELQGLNTSPDEFRTLFRMRDPIDQELQSLTDASDEASVQKRQELEQKREAVVEQVLGSDQFREYKLSQDPLYRASKELAEQLSVPNEKIMPLYDINRETDLEQQRIMNDSSLTSDERDTALQDILASRSSALRKLLGEDAFKRYDQSAKE